MLFRSAVIRLEEALTLALTHADEPAAMRMGAMVGQLRLVQGMQAHAIPYLHDALRRAEGLDDTLAIVTLTSLISGLQLCAEDWSSARVTAQTQLRAAKKRGNWMAVADGFITLSTCALKLGITKEAVRVLVEGHDEMNGVAQIGRAHV